MIRKKFYFSFYFFLVIFLINNSQLKAVWHTNLSTNKCIPFDSIGGKGRKKPVSTTLEKVTKKSQQPFESLGVRGFIQTFGSDTSGTTTLEHELNGDFDWGTKFFIMPSLEAAQKHDRERTQNLGIWQKAMYLITDDDFQLSDQYISKSGKPEDIKEAKEKFEHIVQKNGVILFDPYGRQQHYAWEEFQGRLILDDLEIEPEGKGKNRQLCYRLLGWFNPVVRAVIYYKNILEGKKGEELRKIGNRLKNDGYTVMVTADFQGSFLFLGHQKRFGPAGELINRFTIEKYRDGMTEKYREDRAYSLELWQDIEEYAKQNPDIMALDKAHIVFPINDEAGNSKKIYKDGYYIVTHQGIQEVQDPLNFLVEEFITPLVIKNGRVLMGGIVGSKAGRLFLADVVFYQPHRELDPVLFADLIQARAQELKADRVERRYQALLKDKLAATLQLRVSEQQAIIDREYNARVKEDADKRFEGYHTSGLSSDEYRELRRKTRDEAKAQIRKPEVDKKSIQAQIEVELHERASSEEVQKRIQKHYGRQIKEEVEKRFLMAIQDRTLEKKRDKDEIKRIRDELEASVRNEIVDRGKIEADIEDELREQARTVGARNIDIPKYGNYALADFLYKNFGIRFFDVQVVSNFSGDSTAITIPKKAPQSQEEEAAFLKLAYRMLEEHVREQVLETLPEGRQDDPPYIEAKIGFALNEAKAEFFANYTTIKDEEGRYIGFEEFLKSLQSHEGENAIVLAGKAKWVENGQGDIVLEWSFPGKK